MSIRRIVRKVLSQFTICRDDDRVLVTRVHQFCPDANPDHYRPIQSLLPEQIAVVPAGRPDCGEEKKPPQIQVTHCGRWKHLSQPCPTVNQNPMTTTEIAQTASFDLRRKKWIPVIRNDGTPDELRLEEALATAHQWRAISDPLPTVEFGLYRLLVAFVLDIFAPQNGGEWANLWDDKQFDGRQIAEYFDLHEGAFDLFGAKPFLQSAGMEAEKSKPFAGLLHSMPSGTANNHFHHRHEEDFGVSPACAARFLATIAPFMTAGGAGLSPSINGSPPLYVLPLGENGFETLLLNTPVYADLLLAQGEVGPSWRQTEAISAARATESSLLQSLTWRPRKIQLVPDPSGGVCSLSGEKCETLVRAMKFSPGWGAGFEWTDPNAAYRLGDERTVMRLREGREVWRDTGPLALLRGGNEKTHQRPAIISQIGELGQQNLFDTSQTLDMAIYGLRTDMKMKVFEWQRERLSVPLNLLWEDLGQTEAQNAMNLAEKIAYAVKRAIKITYPREAQGNDKGFETLANSATTLFWRNLRPRYDDYLRFLATKPDEDAQNAQRQKWRYTLRDEGWRALKFAIEDLDGDAKALKRQTDAYANFSRAIFALVEPQKAAEAKAKREKTKEKTG